MQLLERACVLSTTYIYIYIYPKFVKKHLSLQQEFIYKKESKDKHINKSLKTMGLDLIVFRQAQHA